MGIFVSHLQLWRSDIANLSLHLCQIQRSWTIQWVELYHPKRMAWRSPNWTWLVNYLRLVIWFYNLFGLRNLICIGGIYLFRNKVAWTGPQSRLWGQSLKTRKKLWRPYMLWQKCSLTMTPLIRINWRIPLRKQNIQLCQNVGRALQLHLKVDFL